MYLLFMPTFEVGNGFDRYETKKDNITFYIAISGEETESGSRLLNRINIDNPYLLQFGLEQNGQFYLTSQLKQFIIHENKSGKQLFAYNAPSSKQFNYYSKIGVAGYTKDNLNFGQLDYKFHAIFELCEKRDVCMPLEFDGILKFRTKKKFYSNSFANMMGI